MDYTLTVTFRLSTPDESGPSQEEFASRIGAWFRAYEDGRYPFAVEMVERGITDLASDAIQSLTGSKSSVHVSDEPTVDGPR